MYGTVVPYSMIVNRLELATGLDLNGDGYIGGRFSRMERAYGIDINGDGLIGRPYDVHPGFPAVYGYPTMVYGPGGRIFATNSGVLPNYRTQF